MKKIILTTLNGSRIVSDENKEYRAQHIRVDEALADGLSLQQAIDELEGFTEDWVKIEDGEIGWGETLDEGYGEFETLEED